MVNSDELLCHAVVWLRTRNIKANLLTFSMEKALIKKFKICNFKSSLEYL